MAIPELNSDDPEPRADSGSPWKDLGIPEPPHEEDKDAPVIDEAARESLRALLLNLLPEEEARAIRSNVLRYKSWRAESARIAVEVLGKETTG